MKQHIANILFVIIVLFTTFTVQAQAPVDSPEQAITGLLNRIGGEGAADKFKFVIDPSLAQNGKDVFIITSQDGKPCIKGNTQLSVATGINWYLNHYAHINLSWSNPKSDLVTAILPVPNNAEEHICNTTYRYNLNTDAFSNSMALWTWERWQQEIDWMALHGVNAPLNIVGLEVVTRNFLTRLGVEDWAIDTYITGPAFLSWFANNQIQSLGATAWANGVTMEGIPDWWYTRQEGLCRQILTRMRELGMQPVLPGFSGQVPDEFTNKNVNAEDVVDNGIWLNDVHKRPDMVKPGTESYNNLAEIYYEELHNVMGISELYSIDPFHDGSLPNGVTSTECYPGIMTQLDAYFDTEYAVTSKESYNVGKDPKWFIHYHNGMPQSEAFSAMAKNYANRFIALDINADIASNSMWNNDTYNGYPYIFCMLNDFGGRNGMHGRMESTMNNYFNAIANDNSIQGIGATPEGIETNPIVYDMLFELPWMSTRPNLNEWLKDYAHARYGIENEMVLEAFQTLKESVWNCTTEQLGASEAVILARPTWNLQKVSEWGTTALYYNPYDVLQAADKLISVREQITTQDGKNNYNYDVIDIVRQAMVDYAAELLPLINDARKAGNTAEYRRLYELFLLLMDDLDNMLSYNEFFNLATWTHRAHEIADEVNKGSNECNWLECNIRTLITVWAPYSDNHMHDYSNRCWAGLIKDYYRKRWAYFFEKRGNNIADNYWYNNIEYPWSTDFTSHKYSDTATAADMTAAEKAADTFNKTFGRLKSGNSSYLFPMGATRDVQQSGVVPVAYRGETAEVPFEIGKSVLLTSFWIDLNHDGVQSNDEMLEVTDNNVTIPANAEVGKAKAIVTYRDGTSITFTVIINENITTARTVTVTAKAEEGSAVIEATGESSITSTEAVTILATAKTGYNFYCWYDADGDSVSNKNPYTYYSKAPATFTASFIKNRWGVVEGTTTDDIANEGKFVQRITLTRYNRAPETIYETTVAPAEIFTTIPQIINVAQGASFDIEYDNGNNDGLKSCYFRAYIDLNFDGDFEDYGELLHTIGTNGAENTTVRQGKFNVLLPYTMQIGMTHIRLRFDDAFDDLTKKNANSPSSCPVYDIVINVTEHANEASHINVATNNKDWGSVKVWDNETPAGSNSIQLDVAKGAQFTMEATIDEGAEFLGWYDQYDRLVSNSPQQTMYAREDATYTAKIRRILVIDGWLMTFRTVERENGETGVILSKVLQEGKGDLVIPETVTVLGEVCPIIGFDNDLFNYNPNLTSITLPKSLEFVSSIVALDASLSGSGTATVGEDIILDIPDLHIDESWIMEIEVTNEQILTGHGTCLIASGENPRLDFYPGGFQLYLVSSEDTGFGVNRNFLVFKADGQGDDNTHFDDVYTQDHFKVILRYDHTTKTMTASVINADGSNAKTHSGAETLSFTCPNLQTIKTVCTDLAQGVDIPRITIERLETPDAFRGCSNLDAIYVEAGNETYSSKDGCLYDADGNILVSQPEGRESGAERRALRELIKKMESLTAQVATYDPNTLIKNKIELQPIGNSNTNYIWTNATNEKARIGHLTDEITGVEDNYFHGETSSDSIKVFLEWAVPFRYMQLGYHTRTGVTNGFPTNIKVMGSWSNKNDYVELHTINNGLPKENNKEFLSGVFDNQWYYYLCFVVTSQTTSWDMSELELYYMIPKVTVFKTYEGSAVTENLARKCYNELFAAQEVYNTSSVTADIVKAKNTLQALYNELHSAISTVLPFELTLDDENPVLYNIYHKRTGGVIEISHLSNESDIVTHKLSIKTQIKNNTFQAFYFKSHADGIAIYPYNTDEEVLCSNDTSNGSDKVTTAKIDDANYAYKYWSIPFVTEENSTKYYNIKTNGTYLNDYSDYTESLGFKSDSSESDGSLFNFVKAEFENNNPRYYQLIDHLHIHPDGTNIYEGKTVGLYNGGKAYREAYITAKAIKEAGSTSTHEECLKAHEALHEASKKLSLNKASSDKFYFIKSVAEESYCKGQYVHTLYKKTEHGGGGATAFFDHTNLLLCEKMNIHPRPLAIFQFETTENENVYNIKNLHTGMYIQSFTGIQMGTKVQDVRVVGIADGKVALRIGGNDMLAQELYGVITEGDAALGNAAAWEIEEQTDIKEIYQTWSISSAGYSTLCLNYAVKIPFGIIAYTACEVIPGWIRMMKITDGIIPANTPVIIEGNPGTFVFEYTDETGNAENNCNGFEFLGTLYDTYIEKEENYRYYVLSVVKGEIGMYQTLLNKDANGNAGTTHFLNNANKVYLKVDENATVSLSSFMRFSFGKENTNIIEDIEEESNDAVIFDLQGRRITEITKPGFYIVNGKKTLVK